MAKSRSFIHSETRKEMPKEGEYTRVCMLCWQNDLNVQDQESDSSAVESDQDLEGTEEPLPSFHGDDQDHPLEEDGEDIVQVSEEEG
jgi:hypothetical protein